MPYRLRSTEQSPLQVLSLSVVQFAKGTAYPTEPHTALTYQSRNGFSSSGRSTSSPLTMLWLYNVTEDVFITAANPDSGVKQLAKAVPVFHLLFHDYVKPFSHSRQLESARPPNRTFLI